MPEKISENEKQQYLEGPWNRVSGDSPLNQFELDGWKDNLDAMYGESNWQAVPNTEDPAKHDIVVSPDYNSVYAGVARSVDKEGLAGFPASDPRVEAVLGHIALEEVQTQTHQPTHVEVVDH